MSERLTIAQRAALSGKSEEQRAVIEEESSLWMVQCRNCGFEASVWDRGGVRTGAGGAKTQRLRCPDCGKRGSHDVYWAGRDEPAGSPLREAGRVDRSPPPVQQPRPRAARALPIWVVLVPLLVFGAVANSAFNLSIPVWLLVIFGFAVGGARMVRGTDGEGQDAETRVSATFTGAGCLLVLGLVLLGWILSRTVFLAQQG